MNEQTLKALSDLAEKLGVTVEYLWDVIVQGTRLSGYVSLCVVFPLAIAAYVGFRFLRYALTAKFAYEDDLKQAFYGVTGGAVMFISAMILVINLYEGAMEVAAPEYMALQTILKYLAGTK